MFLRKLEDGDRFISLREIQKFRRISSLTNAVAHIQSALEFSKVVELSNDGQRVRKRIPT